MILREYDVLASDARISDYTRIGYIGEPIILHGKHYDPDQTWLPFMQGVILRYAPSDYYVPGKPPSSGRRWLQTLVERPVTIPQGCEKMYEYSCAEQMLLPFREYQRTTSNEFDFAKRSWDRKGPDEFSTKYKRRVTYYNLFSISMSDVKNLTHDELDAWCRAHLRGRFMLDSGQLFFEYEVDWLFTKLRFRGEDKIEDAA